MSENALAELIRDPAPTKRGRVSASTVLAVLATLYTLYFAREFLLPIVFAILLDFLLQPAVRFLVKLRIPEAVGAALVVLGLIGVTSLVIYEISGPVQTWVTKAPESIEIAQREVGKLIKPLERMLKRTTDQVQQATGPAQASRPAVVVVQGPSMLSRAFGSTSRFLGAAFEVLILLYFMLATGDLFLRKLIKVLPHLQDKLKASIANADKAKAAAEARIKEIGNDRTSIMGLEQPLFELRNPGLVSIPLGFLAVILGSLLYRDKRSEDMWDELYVRQNTGLLATKAAAH